jgi:hypothetical protein
MEKIGDKLIIGHDFGLVIDHNGNRVGIWKICGEESDNDR